MNKLPEWWVKNWGDKPYAIADCLEAMKLIPDKSIDLVFTDPPYPREFIHLYWESSREIKRVLKEGGYCIMYLGGDSLDEIIPKVCEHLKYFWLFGLKHNGGHPRYWAKKIMVGFKPILITTNGPPVKMEWMDNLFEFDSKEKKGHEWGQSVNFPIQIIEILTDVGQIIFDPFLGSGTTLLATRKTDRIGLGFEINKDYESVISKRIMENTPNIEEFEQESV